MKKREYKVKYENGEIKPLEPIDLNSPEEGIVIFMDDVKAHFNTPIKGCFPTKDNDIEDDIRNLREEASHQVEKKFKNWNM